MKVAGLQVDAVLAIVDELTKEHSASDYDRQWTLGVAKRVIQLIAEPAYEPDEVGGFALSESAVVPFEGDLAREDAVYEAFLGEEVDVAKSLEWLRSYDIVTARLYRPDPSLLDAVMHLWDVSPKSKNKPRPSLAPLTACKLLAGRDRGGAELLHQIRYWGDKMKIRRGGKLWIVKTAAEWQAETGLAKNQYERALRCLKDRGLVETEQHMSGIYGGMAVTYLRPIYYIGLGDRLKTAQQEEAA